MCRLTAEGKGGKRPFWEKQGADNTTQVTSYMEPTQENQRQENHSPSLQLGTWEVNEPKSPSHREENQGPGWGL